MALGNIQWRFQEPVDFSTQLNNIAERKAKIWSEIGKNLGGGLQGYHDHKLDEELADMMEGYDKQGAIDNANKEQMTSETKLINDEIAKLEARQQSLVKECEQLKAQREQIASAYTQQPEQQPWEKMRDNAVAGWVAAGKADMEDN